MSLYFVSVICLPTPIVEAAKYIKFASISVEFCFNMMYRKLDGITMVSLLDLAVANIFDGLYKQDFLVCIENLLLYYFQ